MTMCPASCAVRTCSGTSDQLPIRVLLSRGRGPAGAARVCHFLEERQIGLPRFGLLHHCAPDGTPDREAPVEPSIEAFRRSAPPEARNGKSPQVFYWISSGLQSPLSDVHHLLRIRSPFTESCPVLGSGAEGARD